MATVAQLAARPYQEIGYLFVVEGWPVAFTNRVELTGSGASSWIGNTADYGAGRTVVLGLEVPRSIKLAVGIVESGMPIDDGATFTIVDREDYLVTLMTDDPGTVLYDRLAASSSACAATLVGAGGNNVSMRPSWINGEAIGSSGERRQWQVLPGNPMPGYEHPAVDAVESTLRPSIVRTAARWLEGLPCALYLIRKDVDAGTWPSWSDQYASGYSLIWWGTLRGASAESVAWKLQCDGPSSWLRRTLNVSMPSEWRPLTPVLELATGEDRIAVAFSLRAPLDETEVCAVSAFDDPDDVITSGQTPAELAGEINTRLQTLAGTTGTDGTFSTFTSVNGSFAFHESGATIKVDENTASTQGYPLAGVVQLRMHQKAWSHLGWDVAVQGRAVGAGYASEYEVGAQPIGDAVFYPVEGSPTADPATGYWEAVFTTFPLGLGWADGWHLADGKGSARTYRPVYGQGGSTSVLYSDGQQSLDLGFGVDAPFMLGQLAKPPADVTLSTGACDRAGFVVVRGPYRTDLEEDAETIHQVARISWNANGNQVDTNAGVAVAWLESWLTPRHWGGTSKKLSGPWAMKAGQVEYCPIALLSYHCDHNGWADAAQVVLLRLLLSTGTASWSGVGDAATITSGDNAHADASGAADDLETADLGLGIPQELVDWHSFVDAAEALPGGQAGDLVRCRLAYLGPFDSQECIEQILAPRGWCFSLDGGRYGLFARSTPLDVEDVQVALTTADVAAAPDEGPPAESVEFRPLEPVDLIAVRYGASQIGDDGDEREYKIKARDPRSQARRGNATVEIDGRALVPSGAWQPELTTLWGEQLARFYGEPHSMVTVAIKGDKARDLWPGTIVSYTTDWAATRTGAYGMTARLGRVASVERDLQTLATTCEILVEGKDPTSERRFGPIARLVDNHTTVEGRHDASTYTVTCYADAFGRGTSTKDVSAFAEPAWSTTGGNLTAHVWQSWDGVTWEQTASFVVDTVNASANTITYLSNPGLTGTIWENRYGIIVGAPHNDQPGGEWPDYVLGVVCGTDGKFGTFDESGHPWLD